MGQGIYWLHTHDATGIIHVESPDDRTYTLGQFFDIWGQPLTSGEVAGLKGVVRAYIDGKPSSGNPRGIVLGAHLQITLEVGAPIVPPPTYAFPCRTVTPRPLVCGSTCESRSSSPNAAGHSGSGRL